MEKKSGLTTLSCILLCILFSNISFAQVKGLDELGPESFLQQSSEAMQAQNQLLKLEAVPVANPVDPDYYYIGPGDVLSIQILPAFPVSQLMQVSPGLKLMIPRTGLVDLEGKTLSEAKETISETIHNNNPDAEIHIMLTRSRTVLVTIEGNVIMPGTYYLPASYTVSSAIKIANQKKLSNMTTQQVIPSILKNENNRLEAERSFSESGLSPEVEYGQRNIRLLREDGSASQVDLEKAHALDDHRYDPYIREGDRIVVPFKPDVFPVISILGAVMRPVTVPYIEGDDAAMLLKLGRGLAKNADPKDVKLTIPGRSEVIPLSTDNDLNLLSDNFVLEPGSAVIVGEKKIQKHSKTGFVAVRGEIRKPGIYTIEEGTTRLSDIIEKAGGFTERAYLPLASITRRGYEEIPSTNYRYRLMEYFQYSDLTQEDTVRYTIDMNMRRPFVSCDFQAVFNNDSGNDNIVLLDGDIIDIPDNPGHVYVFGQVNQPGYIEFEPGRDKEWYINKAGGYATGAEEDRARIIRGRTKVWQEEGILRAGDEIYVPRPPDVPTSVQSQKYNIIASLIGTSIAFISFLVTILR